MTVHESGCSRCEKESDLKLRPITGPEELELFCELPYVLNAELRDDLAAGRRGAHQMWVALEGERLVARVAWWSRSAGEPPRLLDVLDMDDAQSTAVQVDAGVQLVGAAMAALISKGSHPPDYVRFVPPDWRENAAARRVVETRITVVERSGARLFVERLRFEWSPDSKVPRPSERLLFRPVSSSSHELMTLMVRALDGTLDAHDRDDLTTMSAREAAGRHYDDELARYSSPRDWWRIATLHDGEPVGFVIPAHNGYNPIVAYIAVMPEHRGNGDVDDILAEGTRILASEGVARIRASTDVGNVPMAKAFQRAGYVNFERQIDMRWGP